MVSYFALILFIVLGLMLELRYAAVILRITLNQF